MSVKSKRKERYLGGSRRRGGEKVARERGSEFYRRIGRKGGEKVAEERSSESSKKFGGKAAKAKETKPGQPK